MPLPKPIRLLLYYIAGMLGLVLLLLVIISLFRIPINLEDQKGLIESVAADAINRQVKIDGSIKATTSLWPVFIIEDVHVKNPSGFTDGDFARLQSARIEIGLIRLLLGRIRVKDFEVKGLELFLQTDKSGTVNWIFNDDHYDEFEKPEEKSETQPEKREIAPDAIIVDSLHLENISVSYFAPGMAKPNEFKVDTCSGAAKPGKPFQVILKGSTLDEPYEVSIKAASLDEFLVKNKSWLDIEAKIANARLNFSGNVDLAKVNRSLKLKLVIKGEGLQNFNRLLKLNLPPIPSYGLETSLAVRKNLIEMTDLKLFVSESTLTGTMKAENIGPIQEINLTLHSPLVQINDFIFADWSPFQDKEKTIEAVQEVTSKEAEKEVEQVNAKKRQTKRVRELLSPESLAMINGSITVSADEVLSGEDQIGSGKISAALQDGRINLDPVELNIPGGSLALSMSIKPGRESSEAALRVLVKNFDFGVLARRADPKTNMGGIINIDIDLKSTAQDFSDILAEGNGYFDFSAKPENLQAGIIDLWALNVISVIVSSTVKGKSHIEYILGRWSMNKGVLGSDVFVIDTTRMRICGKGWANFRKQKLELEIAPASKKPEFFSLATPINIQGDFEDFELGIVPGGLIGTGIKFVISPLQVPIQTIFDEPIPADASDLKAIQLGPGNRDVMRPVGCRWKSTGK